MKAEASHILVQNPETCEDLKKQIEEGADFADMAARHSLCPSGKRGGALGEFAPGQMVKEFDNVVFKEEVARSMGRSKPSSATT
jgi:peptidyl-prolyl cis-trans isomerase C